MIIDKDEDIAGLVRAVLDRSGLNALVSPSGLCGVAAVRDQGPALVILDVGLSDMNGLEVICKIRDFSDER